MLKHIMFRVPIASAARSFVSPSLASMAPRTKLALPLRGLPASCVSVRWFGGSIRRTKVPPTNKKPVQVEEQVMTDQEYQRYKEQQQQQQQYIPTTTTQDYQNTPQQQYASEAEMYQAQYGGRTAAEVVDNSVSLQKFLKRSMTYTAAAVGGTTIATGLIMNLPFVAAHPYICLGVGAVGAMGSVFGIGMTQPEFVTEQDGSIRAVDSNRRLALFGGLMIFEGIALAPMLYIASMIAPIAIPVAFGLSVGTMAAMGLYALKQPQGSLMKWGPALYVGIFGLIGVSLVNMFVHSSVLSMISSFAGVAIFSAFTAYDTQRAIQDHNEGHPDHLNVAANYFLNFINLFVDYLRIMMAVFRD